MKHPLQPSDERLLSREELMKRWSISLATLKRMEAEGLLSRVVLMKRHVRFRLSDVIRIEQEGG